jgi:hypothetical protein
MQSRQSSIFVEDLETRQLLAWSGYAQLVHQDTAATDFSTITGKGITVAVIDTGVDYNLKSLGGGFGKGFKVVGGYDFYNNDKDPMDEDGHGTSVASVIAGKRFLVNGVTYQGVAPDAKIVALRVGTETSIPDSNIKAALDWVLHNYKTYGISVVNLSLGSGNYTSPSTDSSYTDEFKQLHDLGIFVTAASGNSNDAFAGPITQDGIAYPAADPSVYAVGAVDKNDVIADFTQRSSELDLLAPGVNITMLKKGGGSVTEDGTSFASPYVAGTAALIKQLNPHANVGDIGSILMSSGKNNRDGDNETGNTTGLQFSRLDIESALKLTSQRAGHYAAINFGSVFDTALDSNGVLHAVYYEAKHDRLLYTTRDISGLWSNTQVIDTGPDIALQLSIAVDTTSKVGVGYYNSNDTEIRYASFNGAKFTHTTVESLDKVGTSPSLGFDINGNAYLAYYKRSGGALRLATLDRDAGTWSAQTVDGGPGSDNVGADVSLDVGEALVRNGFFTEFHTTVAMAYSDSTNGDLKYARYDLIDGSTVFETAVKADGVANIDFHLHESPTITDTLQAQVAYQDTNSADVKYAFKVDINQWTVETVAARGKLGDSVQLWFDSNNTQKVTYYDRTAQLLNTATRLSDGTWQSTRTALSAGAQSVSINDRTDLVTLSYLNSNKSDVFSKQLV